MTTGSSRSNPPSVEEALDALRRLEDNLAIAPDALEAACVQQPDSLYRVAVELSFCRSRRDAGKKELEEKEAALYLGFRHQAAVADERITEAEIKARMTLDRERRLLLESLTKANELLARWEALRDAYLQRSYMLRELCQLYLARYYGDPARSAENQMRDMAADRMQAARRARNDRNHEREE